jgi:hypothetical protein
LSTTLRRELWTCNPSLRWSNEVHLREPVQEKVYPRASCAYHLCQGLLTHLGDYSLGVTFLAEMSQEKQYPGQSLFTGIEKRVN